MSDETTAGQAATRTDATVMVALDHAVEVGQINNEQREMIFWLHGYGLAHGLSNSELGKRINASPTAVSQIFSGAYEAADWSGIVSRIAAFRRRDDLDVRRASVGFVKTTTAEKIHLVCDGAWKDHMPAFIYGASQIGKTFALEEYQRVNNTPAIKYLRCRSGMTLNRFARLLGKACNLRGLRDKANGDLIDEVARSLNENSLLIIDEFHLCMETVTSQASKRLVEYIREIYDLSHCGLVLCGTKVGLKDLEDGPNQMLFDQLRRRGIVKVVMPDVPPVRDINAFARAFGLPALTGETLAAVKDLIKRRGLGVFSAYLSKAAALVAKGAENAPEQIDWDFFSRVARGFERLAVAKEEY